MTIGGETPLMKAIIFNNYENAKLLLRFGADATLSNQGGLNSWQLAGDLKNVQFQRLIEGYYSIFEKLCFIIYVILTRPNPLQKLTGKMVQKLTRYIIP